MKHVEMYATTGMAILGAVLAACIVVAAGVAFVVCLNALANKIVTR